MRYDDKAYRRGLVWHALGAIAEFGIMVMLMVVLWTFIIRAGLWLAGRL